MTTGSIKIRGVVYPSRKQAAFALNITVSAIANAIRRGRIATVGLGRHNPVPKSGRPGIPTLGPDGVTYPSRTAAAKALGVHHSKLPYSSGISSADP